MKMSRKNSGALSLEERFMEFTRRVEQLEIIGENLANKTHDYQPASEVYGHHLVWAMRDSYLFFSTIARLFRRLEPLIEVSEYNSSTLFTRLTRATSALEDFAGEMGKLYDYFEWLDVEQSPE